MSKISELSDGGALQSTDYLIAVRSGGNVKVQLSELPSGIGAGGNIVFGDNEKAIFGAGSDLQIYHDGSASYISDQGTGNLKIQGTQLQLQNAAGTLSYLAGVDGGATTIHHAGFAKLATTSTGIDVTGNIESDTLTVGTSTVAGSEKLRVNGTVLTLGGSVSAPAIGIGDTNSGVYAPTAGELGWTINGVQRLFLDSTGIDVTGTVTADDAVYVEGSSPRLQLQDTDGTTQLSFFQQSAEDLILRLRNNTADGGFTVAGYGGASTTNRFYIQPNGDISFYEDTGTTPKFFWDASTERLGLGTTSPSAILTVDGGTADFGSSGITLKRTGTVTGSSDFILAGTSGSEALSVRVNASEKMRIDSAGNVGIGTTSPSFADGGGLQVQADTFSSVRVTETGNTGLDIAQGSDAKGYVYLRDNADLIFGTNNTERMRIDSAGNVGIGVSSLVTGSTRRVLQVSTGSDGGQIAFADSTTEAANPRIFATNKSDLKLSSANSGSSTIQFITGTTPAERMRIDSSGNLLVGCTSTTADEGGIVARPDSDVSNIYIGHATGTAGGNPYIRFRYGSGNIGSITQSGTTAVLYNTSSDQRLKDNIADADDAGSKIDAIQVRKFDWKADGSHQRYGMVAQELLEVAPEAVSQGATEDDMMGVDYSKLVPMLVKEIQSLRARVAQLEGA